MENKENKKNEVKELDLDQMEKISGGSKIMLPRPRRDGSVDMEELIELSPRQQP